MNRVKCHVCDKELTKEMNIQYSDYLKEFYCSFLCMYKRFLDYLETRSIKGGRKLPEGVIIDKDGKLIRSES